MKIASSIIIRILAAGSSRSGEDGDTPVLSAYTDSYYDLAFRAEGGLSPFAHFWEIIHQHWTCPVSRAEHLLSVQAQTAAEPALSVRDAFSPSMRIHQVTLRMGGK
jgi:hypothetical protein